jgi:hypothetical protein
MELGALASGSVIFALNNTSPSKSLFIKRLSCKLGFVGTPAATRVPIGFARATGVPAGGSSSIAAGVAAKRNPGGQPSIASLNFGPVAITGLAADAAGDFKTTFINHQRGTPLWDEPGSDIKDAALVDPLVIGPGTSLIATTRAVSVAGSGLSVDIEWGEQ